MNCPFCQLNFKDISNTVIEESQNFLVLTSKGSLCDGYLLIIPKQHINSINELPKKLKVELETLIEKYRNKFHNVYNKYPLFFEHGSAGIDKALSSSSVTHAHMHIVNHNFTNENKIINELNLCKVNKKQFFEDKGKNYISYISPDHNYYISFNFKPVSQQMRIYIANDLNLGDNFNWRTSNFDNNIISTINKFKQN